MRKTMMMLLAVAAAQTAGTAAAQNDVANDAAAASETAVANDMAAANETALANAAPVPEPMTADPGPPPMEGSAAAGDGRDDDGIPWGLLGLVGLAGLLGRGRRTREDVTA